jgi:hypothetical protein
MRLLSILLLPVLPLLVQAGPNTSSSLQPPTPMLRQYCFGCHGKASAAAGVNLEQLMDPKSVPGENYQKWKKVVAVLDEKRMPPAKMPQPGEDARVQATNWIRASLKSYVDQHAGDPGRVTVRRLTSGEYGYTIQDLTGLEMKFDRDFVTDSVGGEGFANFGDVQFMQDASLERYLQTAKQIAAHAVIGSGPLQFFADPGKSGFETSAITRINEIYNRYGFRSSSGEGGKPFGVERYGKAIYACWQYKHRAALGRPSATLESLALAQGITGRFAQHIWTVLHDQAATFPTAGAIDRWNKIPAPENSKGEAPKQIAELQNFIVNWPRELLGAGEAAAGGLGDERALVINEETIAARKNGKIKFNIINRGREASKTAKVYLSVASVNPDAGVKPVVIWRGATLRFRNPDRSFGPKQDLASMVDEATRARLQFGSQGLPATDFATAGDAAELIEINLPASGGLFELDIQMELSQGAAEGAVVRCMLSDKPGLFAGRPISDILADPASAGYQQWKRNVMAFGNNLPANSHGEAAPSDKDPIPEPYDNTYNQRERDAFHPKVKYYRTDSFLYEKVLDDATRLKLHHAWNDLLASFPYHDFFLEFVVEKYKLDSIKGKKIADLNEATIRTIPAEPRKYIEKLRAEFLAVRDAQLSGQPGHVNDALVFAAKAWRRPLTAQEKVDLRAFYDKHRKAATHHEAVRLLLSRILVSPAFLYRLEQTASAAKPGERALSPFELASRMSYFLWSSIPDAELERAALAGELSEPKQMEKQVQRMLRDPKARRLSTEFFGQWLGFYRFDQFAGVDTTRFPEFTEDVKSAMYDEATSFFEHIVRNDRPVREMFTANYTFLNQPLAKHYGVKGPVKSPREVERVETAENRGGAFRLGAVLTATSAPLRTSPVKRGDWMLRRILGTPTPPPPADAGSIPADEKSFGGLSLREKLASHQRNATCAGCHSRIDPLGFPMEKYDAVGRWREKYQDGKPIEDASTTADKQSIQGVEGLIDYLKGKEPQVMRNMSQKLIGFALGRTAQASDEPLIEKLAQAGGETSVAKMASEIVMSRQFRYRRQEESTAVQTATNRGSSK